MATIARQGCVFTIVGMFVAVTGIALGCSLCSGCRTREGPDTSIDARGDLALADAVVDSEEVLFDTAASPDSFDAFDASVDSGDTGPSPWIWNHDVTCRPMPAPTDLPVSDASCGDGCTAISLRSPRAYSSPFIGEVDNHVEYGDINFMYDYQPSSRHLRETWHYDSGPNGIGMCAGEGRNYFTSFRIRPGYTTVVCGNANHHWEIHEIEHATNTECTVFSMPFTYAFGATTPSEMRRVRGGYVFLQSFRVGPQDVFFLPDGATEPMNITNCGCVNYLAGSDDVIAFARGTAVSSTLWIARPPFTNPIQVWAPSNLVLLEIYADADNPHRMVMLGGRGDIVCPLGAEVYYFDTDTVESVPPRGLTQDSASSISPRIRGDTVMYLDWSSEPWNPGGCPEDPHEFSEIVTTSVTSGGRNVIARAPGLDAIFIATDRLYGVRRGIGFMSFP